jgi:hypothetical protein
MLTPLKTEILNVDDLAHEARRFRTILWSFQRNMELLFRDTGLEAEVDHEALAEAFSRWRLAFDNAKYLAHRNRRDFVIFAAGLMLKELLAAKPLKSVSQRDVSSWPAHIDHRLKRWPEGYAYTSYCLSVATGVLKEMGTDELKSASDTEDPRFWDSFRENSLESPATAVAFFDIVCGETPNWDAPDVPWLRRVMESRDLLENRQPPLK